MKTTNATTITIGLLLVTLARVHVANAQAPAPGAAPATTTKAAAAASPSDGSRADSTDPKEEAIARFKRGLELHGEGDFSAALIEFRKAYELAPQYRVLYN